MVSEKYLQAVREVQAGIRRYFSLCGGGSPANKVFENQTFDSAETMHCRLHVQAIPEVVMEQFERELTPA